jgi:4-hydroxy-2-oxoheptanedioate aldolase
VRTYNHDPALILKLLDMGAEGLLIPGVKNAAEVAALASAFYYTPVGRRGACGHTRVGAYNPRRGEFPEHVRKQNDRVFIWALIEDPESIGNATEIAALQPGASVISVGRGDLSVLLGHAGQIDHPEVVATAERIYRDVREASGGNCACAAMIQTLADVRPWYDRGVRLFTYNADAVVLARAMGEAVDGFRAALPAR